MNNFAEPPVVRWTEDELEREIVSLEASLSDTGKGARPANGHCARAYLRQVLKDRRAALRLLRFRNDQSARTAKKSPSAPRAALAPPRPVVAFEPLLRV